MRASLRIAVVSLVAAGAGDEPISKGPVPAPGASAVLDRASAYYREDHDGRRVARVDAVLEAVDGQVSLRLEVLAEDPLLEPPPGSAGLRGSNAVTAREMGDVLASRRLRVRTTSTDGRAVEGVARPGRVGRLLERRVTADGRVEHRPVADAAGPRSLVLDAGPLGDGRHRTEVLMDGRVAIHAEVEARAGAGRIVSLECGGARRPEARP